MIKIWHPRKHRIDGLIDHTPDPTAVGNNVVVIDPVTKLPTKDSGTSLASILGDVTYQGTWDANTNVPALASGVGTKGHYYVVSVAGTTNLDGITDWKITDWAIFNGTAWEKVDNTDQVASVFSRVGTVVAQASDYDASQVDNDSSVPGTFVDDALNNLLAATTYANQFNTYFVSTAKGDDTTGDGTLYNPYKTITKALTVGYAAGTFVSVLVDDSVTSSENITLVDGKVTSISGLSAMWGSTNPIGTITVPSPCGGALYLDNIIVADIDASAGATTLDVYTEECIIQSTTSPDNLGKWNCFGTMIDKSTLPSSGVTGQTFEDDSGYQGDAVFHSDIDANGKDIKNANEISGTGSSVKITSTNGDVIAKLGDNAGAEKFQVHDSDDAEVFGVDSDGNVSPVGTVDGVDVSAHASDPSAHHEKLTLVDSGGTEVTGVVEYYEPSNYTNGGMTFNFNTSFANDPAIAVGIILGTLADSVYPLTYKITSYSSSSVTIKVYKATMSGGVLTFAECADNEVQVTLTATAEV